VGGIASNEFFNRGVLEIRIELGPFYAERRFDLKVVVSLYKHRVID
jgi:hypothetical protein